MIYSYYPGCTLKTKAKDLDKYARACAEALGVTLEELPDWQCCGGVYPQAKDEIATKLSAVRTLKSAKAEGHDLVTVCSACHNVVKRTNEDMKNDEYIRTRVNNYIADGEPYEGETKVIHYLELLKDVIGFDEIAKKVVNPIGKKIGAYYGCLLLRPSKEMAFDNPENPTIIEDFIKAIGGEPVYYPYRNECCGGYVVLEDKASAEKKSNKVMQSAKDNGAQIVVTACPLCMYNLKKNGGTEDVKVMYFTELLAEALGVK